jgi:hypothetical protein
MSFPGSIFYDKGALKRAAATIADRSGEQSPFQSPDSIITGKKMLPFPFDNALLLFLN